MEEFTTSSSSSSSSSIVDASAADILTMPPPPIPPPSVPSTSSNQKNKKKKRSGGGGGGGKKRTRHVEEEYTEDGDEGGEGAGEVAPAAKKRKANDPAKETLDLIREKRTCFRRLMDTSPSNLSDAPSNSSSALLSEIEVKALSKNFTKDNKEQLDFLNKDINSVQIFRKDGDCDEALSLKWAKKMFQHSKHEMERMTALANNKDYELPMIVDLNDSVVPDSGYSPDEIEGLQHTINVFENLQKNVDNFDSEDLSVRCSFAIQFVNDASVYMFPTVPIYRATRRDQERFVLSYNDPDYNSNAEGPKIVKISYCRKQYGSDMFEEDMDTVFSNNRKKKVRNRKHEPTGFIEMPEWLLCGNSRLSKGCRIGVHIDSEIFKTTASLHKSKGVKIVDEKVRNFMLENREAIPAFMKRYNQAVQMKRDLLRDLDKNLKSTTAAHSKTGVTDYMFKQGLYTMKRCRNWIQVKKNSPEEWEAMSYPTTKELEQSVCELFIKTTQNKFVPKSVLVQESCWTFPYQTSWEPKSFNSVEDMSKFWEGCLFNTSIPALVAGCLSKREHDQQLKEIERQRFASIPTNNKKGSSSSSRRNSKSNYDLSDRDFAKMFDYINDAFDDVTEDDHDPELDETREEEEEEVVAAATVEDELDTLQSNTIEYEDLTLNQKLCLRELIRERRNKRREAKTREEEMRQAKLTDYSHMNCDDILKSHPPSWKLKLNEEDIRNEKLMRDLNNIFLVEAGVNITDPKERDMLFREGVILDPNTDFETVLNGLKAGLEFPSRVDQFAIAKTLNLCNELLKPFEKSGFKIDLVEMEMYQTLLKIIPERMVTMHLLPRDIMTKLGILNPILTALVHGLYDKENDMISQICTREDIYRNRRNEMIKKVNIRNQSVSHRKFAAKKNMYVLRKTDNSSITLCQGDDSEDEREEERDVYESNVKKAQAYQHMNMVNEEAARKVSEYDRDFVDRRTNYDTPTEYYEDDIASKKSMEMGMGEKHEDFYPPKYDETTRGTHNVQEMVAGYNHHVNQFRYSDNMVCAIPEILEHTELLKSLSNVRSDINKSELDSIRIKMTTTRNGKRYHHLVSDYVVSNLLPMYKRQGPLIANLKYLVKCTSALKSNDYSVESKQRELRNIIRWINHNDLRRLKILVENLLQDMQQTFVNLTIDLVSFVNRHEKEYMLPTDLALAVLGNGKNHPLESWKDLDWVLEYDLELETRANARAPHPQFENLCGLLISIQNNKSMIADHIPTMPQRIPLLYNDQALLYISYGLSGKMVSDEVIKELADRRRKEEEEEKLERQTLTTQVTEVCSRCTINNVADTSCSSFASSLLPQSTTPTQEEELSLQDEVNLDQQIEEMQRKLKTLETRRRESELALRGDQDQVFYRLTEKDESEIRGEKSKEADWWQRKLTTPSEDDDDDDNDVEKIKYSDYDERVVQVDGLDSTHKFNGCLSKTTQMRLMQGITSCAKEELRTRLNHRVTRMKPLSETDLSKVQAMLDDTHHTTLESSRKDLNTLKNEDASREDRAEALKALKQRMDEQSDIHLRSIKEVEQLTIKYNVAAFQLKMGQNHIVDDMANFKTSSLLQVELAHKSMEASFMRLQKHVLGKINERKQELNEELRQLNRELEVVPQNIINQMSLFKSAASSFYNDHLERYKKRCDESRKSINDMVEELENRREDLTKCATTVCLYDDFRNEAIKTIGKLETDLVGVEEDPAEPPVEKELTEEENLIRQAEQIVGTHENQQWDPNHALAMAQAIVQQRTEGGGGGGVEMEVDDNQQSQQFFQLAKLALSLKDKLEQKDSEVQELNESYQRTMRAKIFKLGECSTIENNIKKLSASNTCCGVLTELLTQKMDMEKKSDMLSNARLEHALIQSEDFYEIKQLADTLGLGYAAAIVTSNSGVTDREVQNIQFQNIMLANKVQALTEEQQKQKPTVSTTITTTTTSIDTLLNQETIANIEFLKRFAPKTPDTVNITSTSTEPSTSSSYPRIITPSKHLKSTRVPRYVLNKNHFLGPEGESYLPNDCISSVLKKLCPKTNDDDDEEEEEEDDEEKLYVKNVGVQTSYFDCFGVSEEEASALIDNPTNTALDIASDTFRCLKTNARHEKEKTKPPDHRNPLSSTEYHEFAKKVDGTYERTPESLESKIVPTCKKCFDMGEMNATTNASACESWNQIISDLNPLVANLIELAGKDSQLFDLHNRIEGVCKEGQCPYARQTLELKNSRFALAMTTALLKQVFAKFDNFVRSITESSLSLDKEVKRRRKESASTSPVSAKSVLKTGWVPAKLSELLSSLLHETILKDADRSLAGVVRTRFWSKNRQGESLEMDQQAVKEIEREVQQALGAMRECLCRPEFAVPNHSEIGYRQALRVKELENMKLKKSICMLQSSRSVMKRELNLKNLVLDTMMTQGAPVSSEKFLRTMVTTFCDVVATMKSVHAELEQEKMSRVEMQNEASKFELAYETLVKSIDEKDRRTNLDTVVSMLKDKSMNMEAFQEAVKELILVETANIGGSGGDGNSHEKLVDKWVVEGMCGSSSSSSSSSELESTKKARKVIETLIHRVDQAKSFNHSLSKYVDAHGKRAAKLTKEYSKVLSEYYDGIYKKALVESFEDNYDKLKKLGSALMTLTVVNNSKIGLGIVDTIYRTQNFFMSDECQKFLERLYNVLLNGSLDNKLDRSNNMKLAKETFATHLRNIRLKKKVDIEKDQRSDADRAPERDEAYEKTIADLSNWNNNDTKTLKKLGEHLGLFMEKMRDLSCSKNGYALTAQEKRAENLKLVIRKLINGYSAMKNQLTCNDMKLELMMKMTSNEKIVLDRIALNSLDWSSPELHDLINSDMAHSELCVGDFQEIMPKKNSSCLGTCDGCSCDLHRKVATVFAHSSEVTNLVADSVEGAQDLMKDIINETMNNLVSDGTVLDCQKTETMKERMEALERQMTKYSQDNIATNGALHSHYEPFISNGEADRDELRMKLMEAMIMDISKELDVESHPIPNYVPNEVSRQLEDLAMESQSNAKVIKKYVKRYTNQAQRNNMKLHAFERKLLYGDNHFKNETDTGIKIKLGEHAQKYIRDNHGHKALIGAIDNIVTYSGASVTTFDVLKNLESEELKYGHDFSGGGNDSRAYTGVMNTISLLLKTQRAQGFKDSISLDSNVKTVAKTLAATVEASTTTLPPSEIENGIDPTTSSTTSSSIPLSLNNISSVGDGRAPVDRIRGEITNNVLSGFNAVSSTEGGGGGGDDIRQQVNMLREKLMSLSKDDIRTILKPTNTTTLKPRRRRINIDLKRVKYQEFNNRLAKSQEEVQIPSSACGTGLLQTRRKAPVGSGVTRIVRPHKATIQAEGFLKKLLVSLLAKKVSFNVRRLDTEKILQSLMTTMPAEVLQIPSMETMVALAVANSLKKSKSIDVNEGVRVARENYGIELSKECLTYFVEEGANAINTLNIAKGLAMSLKPEKFKPIIDRMNHLATSVYPNSRERLTVINNMQMTIPNLEIKRSTYEPRDSFQQRWLNTAEVVSQKHFVDIGRFLPAHVMLKTPITVLRMYAAIWKEYMKKQVPKSNLKSGQELFQLLKINSLSDQEVLSLLANIRVRANVANRCENPTTTLLNADEMLAEFKNFVRENKLSPSADDVPSKIAQALLSTTPVVASEQERKVQVMSKSIQTVAEEIQDHTTSTTTTTTNPTAVVSTQEAVADDEEEEEEEEEIAAKASDTEEEEEEEEEFYYQTESEGEAEPESEMEENVESEEENTQSESENEVEVESTTPAIAVAATEASVDSENEVEEPETVSTKPKPDSKHVVADDSDDSEFEDEEIPQPKVVEEPEQKDVESEDESEDETQQQEEEDEASEDEIENESSLNELEAEEGSDESDPETEAEEEEEEDEMEAVVESEYGSASEVEEDEDEEEEEEEEEEVVKEESSNDEEDEPSAPPVQPTSFSSSEDEEEEEEEEEDEDPPRRRKTVKRMTPVNRKRCRTNVVNSESEEEDEEENSKVQKSSQLSSDDDSEAESSHPNRSSSINNVKSKSKRYDKRARISKAKE